MVTLYNIFYVDKTTRKGYYTIDIIVCLNQRCYVESDFLIFEILNLYDMIDIFVFIHFEGVNSFREFEVKQFY